MKKRPVNNPLGLAVLAYLSRGDLHPYELGKTLRKHGHARSIRFNPGTLYAVFDQLEAAGLIAATETQRDGLRPERTLYRITNAGRAEFRDWLDTLIEQPQHEYPGFVAALALVPSVGPDDTVRLLRRRLKNLDEYRVSVRAEIDAPIAAGVHPLFLVDETYRVALLDAEIAFIRKLLLQITNPKDGWERMWRHAFAENAGSLDQ